MPKRTGFLFEQVIAVDNCVAAVMEMTRGKGDNGRAIRMRKEAQKYGEMVSLMLENGTWEPSPYKEHTIKEGVRKKERNIKAPRLIDQIVHHAVMRVTVPHIERRNYYYNCGSIPGAGQKRATDAVKKWMSMEKGNKYCALFDVRKFYDTCPEWAVMGALRKIFKDERFLGLHKKILMSMGGGLAIGFYPSQWYANLILGAVDVEIKQKINPDCRYVRYMDDMCLLSDNKRKLHKSRKLVSACLDSLGLEMKGNHRIFKVGDGFVPFLSYKFYHGYTLLKKPLMYRIAAKAKVFSRNKSPHNAKSMASYLGLIKHCDGRKFLETKILPVVNIKKCRRIISDESRSRRDAIKAV